VQTEDESQAAVARWFDATYRERGFGYLRPFEAYPIYLQMLDARPGEALLDVGCGAGHVLRAAAQRGLFAAGADLSRRGLALARGYVPSAALVQANGEQLCFADHSFDLVVSIGVLERFLHPERALSEMARVARPGARLCLMVRNSLDPRWLVWTRWRHRAAEHGHHGARTLEAWRRLFLGSGFTVDAVHGDQWPRQRLRRLVRLGRAPALGAEPIARPWLPLGLAPEFIFVLRKGTGA
jgi:SAM-dependent methyltransferase